MPFSSELAFEPVMPEDYAKIYPYTASFGENSCQHSPVSMFSLSEKYGDSVCERGGVLYTLRSALCDERFRVYLAPLGGDEKTAFETVFADAAAHGKRVKFHTLTEKSAGLLREAFPERFEITEVRDLAEYIYSAARMAAFSGNRLKKRRNEVNAFWSRYGERASVERIRPEDFAEILAYEQRWVAECSESHDAASLEREERMIAKQLRFFDELRLSGVVLRLDGEIRGFGYGTKLNDRCYDAIVEKGDRSLENAYKVLRQESVKQCAMDCACVNLEEDVGVEGLRALKLAYQPEYLLRKFIATERERA